MVESFTLIIHALNVTRILFTSAGMGTEKLEEILQKMFLQAHIVRMDADSTRKKNAHARLLKEFEEKGDILVGTQMVAKGLDYKRVSVVGILQAECQFSSVLIIRVQKRLILC